MPHAEAVFLVDYQQPKVLEYNIAAENLVRANHDIDGAGLQSRQRRARFLRIAKSRQLFNPHRPVRETIEKCLVMLLREQGGRDEHRDLVTVVHGDKSGAHRHLRFAETDVAADQAIHRFLALHLLDHGFDRRLLIGRFLEREILRERVVGIAVEPELEPNPRFATRLHIEQFDGDVVDTLRRPLFRFLPLAAAEFMQRRVRRVDPGITADQVEIRDRHVQLVAVGIFELDEFVLDPADG